jgi:hypothetical protein
VGNCTGPIYGSGFSTQITLSVVTGAAKSATTADSRGPGPPLHGDSLQNSSLLICFHIYIYIYNFFLLSSQIGTSMPSEDGGGNLSTAALPNILEYGN